MSTDDLDIIEDEIDFEVPGVTGLIEDDASSSPIRPGPRAARPGRAVFAAGAHRLERTADALVWWFAGLGELPPAEHASLADVEYWRRWDADRARLATAADVVVCAHGTDVVTVDAPAGAEPPAGVWVTLTEGGSPFGDDRLVDAAAAHANRTGGRALAFPGQHHLAGDVPVSEVMVKSAVEEIVSTGGAYEPDAVLRTHGYARPSYEHGRLVLRTGHDDPRLLVPWEVRYTPPCCGEHAHEY